MTEHRQVTLADFLTDEEIRQCATLYRSLGSSGLFAQTVAKEVMEPNMPRINKALGQENDPRYLAYMVEYVMMQSSTK